MTTDSSRLLLAICTRNRPTFLSTCLASIENMEPVREWLLSLVVIDNSERADVRQTNQAIVGALNVTFPVAHVHEAELGISSARNRALAIADTDDYAAVVYLDDDQAVPRVWLRQLIASWQEAATDVMKSSVVIEKVASMEIEEVEAHLMKRGIDPTNLKERILAIDSKTSNRLR